MSLGADRIRTPGGTPFLNYGAGVRPVGTATGATPAPVLQGTELVSKPKYQPGDELSCPRGSESLRVRIQSRRATEEGWVYEVRTLDHKRSFDVREDELSAPKPARAPKSRASILREKAQQAPVSSLDFLSEEQPR